jgi:hypothetical protein
MRRARISAGTDKEGGYAFSTMSIFKFRVESGPAAGISSEGDFIFDATGHCLGNADEILRTVNTSRQLQLGLKFIF